MSTKEYIEPTPLELAFELRMRAFFQDDAYFIAQQGVEHALTIIAGPKGVGKSTFLLPEISSIYNNSGVTTHRIDLDKIDLHQPLMETLKKEIPRVDTGILLLDEAGVFSYSYKNDGISTTLEYAHKRGWNVIAFLAYTPSHPEVKKGFFKKWALAERLLTQQEAQIVDLPIYRLDRDTARIFIQKVKEWSQIQHPPEIVEYILDMIPYSMRLLKLVSFYNYDNTDDVLDNLAQNLDHYSATLTKEEIEVFQQKVLEARREQRNANR